jgi:hypothetical protein
MTQNNSLPKSKVQVPELIARLRTMARGEHTARGGRRRLFVVSNMLVSSLVTVLFISVLVQPTNSFAWSNLQRQQRLTPWRGRRKKPVVLHATPSPLESPIDDERRPRRLESSPAIQQRREQLQSQTLYPWNDWGIEHIEEKALQPVFPATVDACTDAAWDAIAATLYNKQRMDPNVVQNILKGDTVHGRRPVRGRKDAGRIGIEIDGASCMFRQGEIPRINTNNSKASLDASAIRRVSLILAGKLSQGPWKGYEKADTSDSTSTTASKGRQVAVYFNTIKQALAASHELQLLKRIERHGQTEAQHNRGKKSSSSTTSYYDNIQVLCLGQNEGIPKSMREKRGSGIKKKTMAASLTTGDVDPTKGLLLVVQPTDYNAEYRPPGPSVGTVEALQKLVTSAAIEHVATVVLSPRFLANEIPYSGGSWDQSGFQQSATYGGIEPPRGPTPWLMRDFSPPVFSWVGSALPLGRTSKFRDALGDPCYYSGVSLLQSVMHQGHSWHLFVTKEQLGTDKQHEEQRTTASSAAAKPSSKTKGYQYLANTKSASGRPTRNVLRRIFGDFAPYD